MAAFAIVISEKGGGERRQVFDKDEIHVGRIQSNDLMLPKGNVSKRHATLSLHEGRFVVRDENSTNGTYVNRRRISQATIVRQGDRIYVGDFILRIETPSEAELSQSLTQTADRRSPQPTGLDFSDKTVKTAAENIPRPATVPQGLAPSTIGSSIPNSDELESDRSQPGGLAIPSRRPPRDLDEEPFADAKLTALVGQLVSSVFRRLEPGLLEKEITDAVRQRVSRVINEQAAALERRAAFEGGPEKERVLAQAHEELLDLGPLQYFLADDSIQQIAVSTDQRILIWDQSGYLATNTAFSSEQSLRWAVVRLCRGSKAPLGPDETFVERELANGFGLEASLADERGGSFVVLSRPAVTLSTLDDLVERGELSRKVASFLELAVETRRNLLVVGLPGAVAQQLLGALAYACQEDPFVILERRQELLTGSPAIRLKERARLGSNEEIALACRLPGARLIVTHFGGSSGWQVLAALSAGCSGALLATQARSAELAFELKAAELMVSGALPTGTAPDVNSARRWLATVLDLVVEVGVLADGQRRVLRVAEVVAGEPAGFRDVFRFVVDRKSKSGVVEGSYQALSE